MQFTQYSQIHSRWRDLPEAPRDALENQILDSGAEGPEGPEEPDNPEPGQSGILTTS